MLQSIWPEKDWGCLRDVHRFFVDEKNPRNHGVLSNELDQQEEHEDDSKIHQSYVSIYNALVTSALETSYGWMNWSVSGVGDDVFLRCQGLQFFHRSLPKASREKTCQMFLALFCFSENHWVS